MKSLNKTLSLVLALCLVFSLMGVAGASDYKDDETIQYNEAVDVMTHIGVIDGIGNDTFAPTATVTRAQAAKMIAYAVLGPSVAEKLPAETTKFADVDATVYSWATGSINYLTSRGIINGTSETTFNPEGKVTATQMAKMLLCAAGYGVNGEFVGPNWAINTTVSGKQLGVYAGTKATNFNGPATREEAALYAFNGITKVHQVVYSGLYGQYIGKGTGNGTTDLSKAKTIKQDIYPKVIASAVPNAVAQPVTEWDDTGVEIGKYPIEAKFTYTKFMNDADGIKALEKELKHYTFGDTKTGFKPMPKTAAAVAALTGNGTVVELYCLDPDDSTIITHVAVIPTELAQVAKIDKYRNEVTVRTIDNKYYVADDENPCYEALKAMKIDDYVLVNKAYKYNVVANIAAPEVVTGKIEAVATKTIGGESVVVGVKVAGKSYPLSANAMDEFGDLDATSVNSKKDCTLFVDTYGYAIGIKDATSTEEYVVLGRKYTNIVNDQIVTMFDGITTDGSTIKMNVGTGTTKLKEGQLCSYTSAEPVDAVRGADYSLTKVENDTATLNAKAGVIQLKAGEEIKNSDVKLDAEGEDSNATIPGYYDSDVNFVFLKEDNGIYSVSSVATGVQGVSEIPENSAAIYSKVGKDKYRVTSVFIFGESDTASSESLALIAEKTGTTKVGNKPADIYAILVDGVPTMNAVSTKTGLKPGSFATYCVNEETGLYNFIPYTTTDKATSVITGAVRNTKDNRLVSIVNEKHQFIIDGNCDEANIVDLSKHSIMNLDDIQNEIDKDNTVAVAAIYNGLENSNNYNTVSYIYVLKVEPKGENTDAKAAAEVDKAIKALDFEDEANPTAEEIKAVEDARAAFDALTDTQEALVENLDDLKADEAVVKHAETKAAVAYIIDTEFNVTLPTGATGTFIVKVGTDTGIVSGGKAKLTPKSPWVAGQVLTAELYNLNDLNTVLASTNFIVKNATGITGTASQTESGVAPTKAIEEALGIDTVTFDGNFYAKDRIAIDGVVVELANPGTAKEAATAVKKLVENNDTLKAKYKVEVDKAVLKFTEISGKVDEKALTASVLNNANAKVTVENKTLGTKAVSANAGTNEVNSLTIAGPAKATGKITVTFNDGTEKVVKTILVTKDDSAATVATNIDTAFGTELANWTVTASEGNVVFTAKVAEADKTVTIVVAEK